MKPVYIAHNGYCYIVTDFWMKQ